LDAPALLQALGPLFYQVGIPQIAAWFGTVNRGEFPSFGYESYRFGPGLRRAR
jgi:hypothetical protein